MNGRRRRTGRGRGRSAPWDYTLGWRSPANPASNPCLRWVRSETAPSLFGPEWVLFVDYRTFEDCFEPYAPMRLSVSLFRLLADLPPTREDILWFACRFGFLTGQSLSPGQVQRARDEDGTERIGYGEPLG